MSHFTTVSDLSLILSYSILKEYKICFLHEHCHLLLYLNPDHVCVWPTCDPPSVSFPLGDFQPCWNITNPTCVLVLTRKETPAYQFVTPCDGMVVFGRLTRRYTFRICFLQFGHLLRFEMLSEAENIRGKIGNYTCSRC